MSNLLGKYLYKLKILHTKITDAKILGNNKSTIDNAQVQQRACIMCNLQLSRDRWSGNFGCGV